MRYADKNTEHRFNANVSGCVTISNTRTDD